MSDTDIAKIIGGMVAMFPNAKISKVTVAGYVNMLQDIELDLLRAACRQCVAESEWFPTVAKIRAKALDLTRDTSIPTAFEAWEEVCENAKYSCDDFSHEMIRDAVRAIGGIKMLGQADNDNMIAHRARFLECYGRLESRDDRDRAMLPGVRAVAERMATVGPLEALPK